MFDIISLSLTSLFSDTASVGMITDLKVEMADLNRTFHLVPENDERALADTTSNPNIIYER